MTEFTKGKWTADDMGEYVFAHGFDMMICQMRGWAYLKAQGLSDEEAIEVQKANARLIAAAPEMYEVLKEVLNAPDFAYGMGFSFCRQVDDILARIDGKEKNTAHEETA